MIQRVMDEKPRSLGREHPVALDGTLSPWRDGQPILLTFSGNPKDLYFAVFSTEEKLRALLAILQVQFDTIKCVTDGPEFLSSLPSSIDGLPLHLVLDPYLAPNGRVRWTEVFFRS